MLNVIESIYKVLYSGKTPLEHTDVWKTTYHHLRSELIAFFNAVPPPPSKKNFTIHPPINKTLNS